MVVVFVFLLPLFLVAAGGARPPPVPSPPSSSSSRNDVYSANKRALLAAIASARAGGGGDRATILSCVAALESQYAETQRPGQQQQKQRPNACAAGKWSLVYSTKERAPSTSDASTKSAVDQLSAQAYSVFFRFAPFLAGGQDTAVAAAAIAPAAKADGLAKKLRLAASNTQEVDLAAGRALNTVTVAAPALTRWRLRIVVAGDVSEAVDGATGAPSPDVLAVTFTNFLVEFLPPPVRRTAEAADGDDAIAAPMTVDTMTTPAWTLALPLPRPTGSLRTTFCDSDIRVSRGGQGGVFVVKRIP